jgi:putative ABC transport system substrate-binding protein
MPPSRYAGSVSRTGSHGNGCISPGGRLPAWSGAVGPADRRAGRHRILRGANPADLPVQFSTKSEIVVNLKTAKALGITVPQSILLRADEVIE